MSAGRWAKADTGAVPQICQMVYLRVVWDQPGLGRGHPPSREMGYFDGGEWKGMDGVKLWRYGGTVTHWFQPPELPE